MLEILKKTYPLTASDIDCHGLCKLSALLGYLQNMATEHAELMCLDGAGLMADHNAVWMIARLDLRLSGPIAHSEDLTIHTYHRGVGKSPVIFRDFDLFRGDEPIGEATMSWVLADVDERRILKPGAIPKLVGSPKPAVVKDLIPAKIKMPPELTESMTRAVRYSDTDINGHMNNTKYADIACDAIRYDLCKGQFIAEAQINYLHECFPGDDLLILKAQADNAHYVCGTDAEGKVRFEVRLALAK
ncbi:MAG: thioesterase [Oscillospiraceae bacterium]|nr:thioesterase [Oscillospiraceae bacterium]